MNHMADPMQVLRFQTPLKQLRELLAAETKPDAVIEVVAEKDGRGLLFKLEGLLRIYERIYGGSFLALRLEIKRAEDLVGKYTEKLEYLEYGKKVKASPRVLAELERVSEAAKADLRKYLPELSKLLERLQKDVGELDWHKPKADREAVLKEIRRELKKLQPLDHDMGDLQLGIHKMRRDLRWILIYIQALEGLIILEKGGGTINEYSYLATHPIAESRFSKVEPNARIKKPAALAQNYFLALSKVVQEVGTVKSSAENVEALAAALLASGQARTQHQAHVLATALAHANDPGHVADHVKAATLSKAELKRTKLLKRMREQLE